MPVIVVEDAGIPDVIVEQLGDGMIGTMGCISYHHTVDNPANREYLPAFKAKYDRTPESIDLKQYTGMQVVLAALKATRGNTDADMLMKAMLDLEMDTPMGHITFIPERQPCTDALISEVQKVGGKLQWVPLETVRITPKVYKGSPYYPWPPK